MQDDPHMLRSCRTQQEAETERESEEEEEETGEARTREDWNGRQRGREASRV